MTIKTLRLPDHQMNAVRDVCLAEQVEEATALRKLLSMEYELYPAEQYRAGRISLRETARRPGAPLGGTLDALQRLGIPGNVPAADALQSLESLGRR